MMNLVESPTSTQLLNAASEVMPMPNFSNAQKTASENRTCKKSRLIEAIKDDFKEIKKLIAMGAGANEPTARHSNAAGEKTATTDDALAPMPSCSPSPKLKREVSDGINRTQQSILVESLVKLEKAERKGNEISRASLI